MLSDPFFLRSLPAFTSLWLSVWKLLMPVGDSPSSYITFALSPFILFHLWLTFLINRSPFSFHFTSPPHPTPTPLSVSSALLHQPGEPTVTDATTTRAGGSAGSIRGTATEREGTTEECQARAITTPTSEPKFKRSPFPSLFCCPLQFACFPVAPSSCPTVLKHFTPSSPKFSTWAPF